MDKKVMFVTGGTRNLGLAIARRFASEGYDICISGRDGERARAAAESVMKEYPGIEARGYEMSLKDVNEIERAFAQIKEDFGRLDVFVPNAVAMGLEQSIFNTTPEQFDELTTVNFKSVFFCCQQAVRIMASQKSGGNIVLIGSVQYRGCVPGRIVYISIKGAIMSMTRCIAYEGAKFGIRANCVTPGAIWSERWEAQSEEVTRRRRAQYPIGRESKPEEVANAVYFLASEQSPTITGAELLVDSGVDFCTLAYDPNWDRFLKKEEIK